MEIKKCQNAPAFSANLGKINTRKIHDVFGQEGLDLVERFMPKVVEKDFLDASSTVHISAGIEKGNGHQIEITCEKLFVPQIEEAKGFFGKINNKVKLFFETKVETNTATINETRLSKLSTQEKDVLMEEAAKRAHRYCMGSDMAKEFAYQEKAKDISKLQKQLEKDAIQTTSTPKHVNGGKGMKK